MLEKNERGRDYRQGKGVKKRARGKRGNKDVN